MRIALLLTSLRKSGPAIVATDILKNLNSRNVSFKIFYFDEGNESELDISNVEKQKISFKKYYSFKGFDVIHSHGIRPDAYTYFFRKRLSKEKVKTIRIYRTSSTENNALVWSQDNVNLNYYDVDFNGKSFTTVRVTW